MTLLVVVVGISASTLAWVTRNAILDETVTNTLADELNEILRTRLSNTSS